MLGNGNNKKVNDNVQKNVGIVLDKEFYSDIRVRKEADILVKMVLMYLYYAIVSKITTIAKYSLLK